MKTNKYAIRVAKYRSPLIGGGYCKPGEVIIMFPRVIFRDKDDAGKKRFLNAYVRLNDLHKYPQFKDIHDEIARLYKIDPDTFSLIKTTWRKA